MPLRCTEWYKKETGTAEYNDHDDTQPRVGKEERSYQLRRQTRKNISQEDGTGWNRIAVSRVVGYRNRCWVRTLMYQFKNHKQFTSPTNEIVNILILNILIVKIEYFWLISFWDYIRLKVIAENIVGCTQHDNKCIIVAQTQEPVSDQVPCSFSSGKNTQSII